MALIEVAVEWVKDIKQMCRWGGFKLHKFTSKRKEVIEQILASHRAEEIKHLDISLEALPMERA